MVENWLNDRWRTTPFGSVSRRLSKLITATPTLVRTSTGQCWLAGVVAGEWDGDRESLYRAAAAQDAPKVPWTSATRDRPLTDNDSLVDVVTAILVQAGGPLDLKVLTEVCLRRFPHAQEPREVALSAAAAIPSDETPVEHAALDAADAPWALAEALSIVGSLTRDQQFVLVNYTSIDAMSAHLAVRRSQAYEARSALRGILESALAGLEDRDAVEQQLLPAVRMLTGMTP